MSSMQSYLLRDHKRGAKIETISRPTPKTGEILLQIHACALNFADLLMLEGRYQDMPERPFAPGMEVAGTVAALGPGVTGPAVGSRVAMFTGSGGLAEYGCFPAERAVVLPDATGFEAAAALQIAHGTSHLALTHRGAVQPGETLVVLGAAGGTGLGAVEVGRRLGARVIACARGREKIALAQKAGAHETIDTQSEDLRTRLLALGGCDVVYDPVGGDQFTAAFRACNPLARILSIGFASGEIPPIPANHLMVKNISVLGFYWGGYLKFAPELVRNSLATLFDWQARGEISPHISQTLPLSEVAAGLDLLRQRRATGKVVITP